MSRVVTICSLEMKICPRMRMNMVKRKNIFLPDTKHTDTQHHVVTDFSN